MIIVSQNKNLIINFNNIVSTYVIKNYVSEEKGYQGYNIDFATNEEINFVLATYDTEERAKEVLQEIVSKYKVTLYNSKTNETVVNIPKVYEMPKE